MNNLTLAVLSMGAYTALLIGGAMAIIQLYYWTKR